MERISNFENIKDYKIFIQTFDPKSKIDLSHEDYLYITFNKIGIFERGFNFTKKKNLKKNQFLQTEELFYDKETHRYICKLHQFKNLKKNLAINKRGSEKVNFGYNSGGDEIRFQRMDGKELDLLEVNKVCIQVIDKSEGFERVYWVGKEKDGLKGYLDQMKKKIFFLVFEKMD